MTYDITVTVDLPFEETLNRTVAALQSTGFGVISDLDMHSIFATKLGQPAADELGDYRILGACNPGLAQSALRAEPVVGLLLPCNVVVRRGPGATLTTVQAVDPSIMSQLGAGREVALTARDAEKRLHAALSELSQRSSS
ncbi:DUF302 domain-containing protein [Kineosporia sp. R_H_3]|uniref:DUF302 domain-containing protein n=1 Tax=Kineosporia sp. R_H_3 TaxID=1961848 RepID=UPI000B4B50E6|nr:DUF302 domain-containing protein [Kineosporia sp. R_H_3]